MLIPATPLADVFIVDFVCFLARYTYVSSIFILPSTCMVFVVAG